MAIRVTGLNSGMDTESIINQLASARSVKIQSIKNDQTRLSWKIDAWKSLNTEIYDLYKDLGNLRLESTYSKKTTNVSNSDAVSVLTGSGAVNGTQYMTIESLAQAGYLTGTKITTTTTDSEGNVTTGSPTSTTLLSSLTGMSGVSDDDMGASKITLTVGGEEVALELDSSSTINTVVSQLKAAGLNASFDESNQRFFISSKSSGFDNEFSITAEEESGKQLLMSLGIYYTEDGQLENATDTKPDGYEYATKIMAKDASITLNGATFTSSSNTIEVNGLTFTVSATTSDPIVVTTEQDTSGIYDMIKDFLKTYNTLINKMDTLYNAEDAKDYDPLSDEEKAEMSDTEIEKWETKIKDSLLRRDSTLRSVSAALKEMMATGYDVTDSEGNTTKKYLTSYGVHTLSYFVAADNEKYAYHIDGDEDDDDTSALADKLKAAIATDPDETISFFSQLSKGLYSKLGDLMQSSSYSSAYTVYNNKQMATQLTDYDEEIEQEEDRLNDYLDRWYDKFAQMETALAKLNSVQSSVSSFFGSY
ncbi:MAG: flagellar filament capping protein FliD [Lachnospiraceae bacterium]|nr:flagellar filament capping protein FliD [Lachnospiraceae bacterium]